METPWQEQAMVANNASNSALEAFLASVEKRAYRMAAISLGNPDDGLDVVQDVMMRFCQRYADKPQDEWRPLFFRMLNNRVIDFQRRETLKKRLFFWQWSDDSEDDPISDVASRYADQPDQQVEATQRLQRLDQEVNALPDRQREAFFLRCWEGFSTEETASIMGCTTGSVKTHYSRALNRLKDSLQGAYYD